VSLSFLEPFSNVPNIQISNAWRWGHRRSVCFKYKSFLTTFFFWQSRGRCPLFSLFSCTAPEMGATTTRCRGWTSSGLGDGCWCTEEDEDVGQWVLDLGRDWCGACPALHWTVAHGLAAARGWAPPPAEHARQWSWWACDALSFFVTIQHVNAQIIIILFVPVATHGKVYTVELVSLRRCALRDYVNFTNFAFLD
jgi:hypothetical protein